DVTLRLCPARAPLDLEVAVLAELVPAADLVADHLAPEPAGVVPAVAPAADGVPAGAAAGVLEGAAHVPGGEVDPAVPALVAGAQQRVDAGVVAGGKDLVVGAVGERFQVGTEEYALLLVAEDGAPLVFEAGHGDEADAGVVAHVGGPAGAEAEVDVRVDAVVFLQHVDAGVFEAAADRREFLVAEVVAVDP